jgi:hypothetical protein
MRPRVAQLDREADGDDDLGAHRPADLTGKYS